MVPILYEKVLYPESIDFNNRNFGFIGYFSSCSKCKVDETINGKFVLNMAINTNDRLAQTVISNQMILCKPNNYQDFQFFIIESTKRKTDGTIGIKANHIKHYAFSTVVDGNISRTGTPQKVFNDLGAKLPFGMTFKSSIADVETVPDCGKETIKLGDFLGGSGNSLKNIYNGEFVFDNTTINFVKKRGKNTNYVLRYGSNISSATQEESSEKLYSHVIPIGTVHDEYTNKDIEISASETEITGSECNYHKAINIDCSLVTKSLNVNSNTGAGYDVAENKMKNYAVGRAKYLGYDKRRISIDIDYNPTLDEMQAIQLGDTVNVELNKFGTNAAARITSYTYDVLSERYTKLQIGTPKITLSNILLGG